MLTKKFCLFFMLITFIYLPFLQAKYFVQSILDQFDYTKQITGLYINEFMADNETTIADENGEYDDWVEIFNSNPGAINMEGLFLTDNPAIPDKWQFPDVEIPANGFLLVWTDDDEEQGELHTNFKLDADGEFIGLYEIDGITPIDTLSFGPQEEDISFGRYPDGADNWQFFDEPTPGTSNSPGSVDDEIISPKSCILYQNYPNPFNPTTTISFYVAQLSSFVNISIYNIKGQKVKTLVDKKPDVGFHTVIWNGRDENNQPVGSGVYFYNLKVGKFCETKKMILIK
ncbi:MAG: lamin tail domain-containing protein [Candidatus Cloacimonetes bacterium]|nr:lamin tail domain-containing protein [Candidatus Cloacimonadota bacterium]